MQHTSFYEDFGFKDTSKVLTLPSEFAFLEERHPIYKAREVALKLKSAFYFEDLSSITQKRKFLPRGENEPETFYRNRLRLSEIAPETTMYLQRIVNGIFSENVNRNWTKDEEDLVALEKDVDRQGREASDFMEDVAREAAALGMSFVLVDKPKAEGEIVTLQQEIEAGVRLPMWNKVHPLRVINWRLDRSGNLDEAIVLFTDTFEVGGVEHQRDEYLLWSKSEWRRWIFEGTGSGKLVSMEGSAHGLGVVPLVPVYYRMTAPMESRSASEEAYRLDLLRVRVMSHLTWDAYVHAHPHLVAHTDRELKDLALGSNTFTKLKPPDEKLEYVSPEGNSYAANQWLSEELKMGIARAMGIDPLGVISASPSDTSGVARAWSFKTSEEKILASFAGSLARSERTIWEISARWLAGGGSNVFAEKHGGVIEYPSKFDITAPSERLNDFILIRRQIKSKTFLKNLAQSIALSYASNMAGKDVDAIMDEIAQIDFTDAPEDLQTGFFQTGGLNE